MPDNLQKEDWKLSNLEELRKIFSIGDNFKNDWYMTSETTSDYKNMCIHYEDKREVWRNVTESYWGCCYIRLIKDKQIINYLHSHPRASVSAIA